MERISLIINSSKDGEEKLHKSFLKSLGIKSDSVGWCELDLNAPDAKKKMEKIAEYAKTNSRTIRIYYEYKEDYVEADWYLYTPKDISVDIAAWKEVKVPLESARSGETYLSVVDGIQAYKIPNNVPVIDFRELKATSAIVSDAFRNCVEHNELTGMQFVWARDKGRYHAPDYYRAINTNKYDENKIYISFTEDYEKIRKRKKYTYGPNWTWLSEFNLILQHLSVPALFKGAAPQVDITEWLWGFILSKHAVSCLLDRNLISKTDLSPCHFVDEIPDYYEPITKYFGDNSSAEDLESQILTNDEILAIQKEHEKFSKKVRPIREVKQKDVLKEMRAKKMENPDGFLKPLKKAIKDTLTGTSYEVLLPYLSIADGFCSDEYDFLSYEQMKDATAEYTECKQEEELETLPDGIQIAVSGGGDYIIMTTTGVFRYSHEDWSIENEWKNIDLFVSEMLEGIE